MLFIIFSYYCKLVVKENTFCISTFTYFRVLFFKGIGTCDAYNAQTIISKLRDKILYIFTYYWTDNCVSDLIKLFIPTNITLSTFCFYWYYSQWKQSFHRQYLTINESVKRYINYSCSRVIFYVILNNGKLCIGCFFCVI
jgi:hypothetical protein